MPGFKTCFAAVVLVLMAVRPAPALGQVTEGRVVMPGVPAPGVPGIPYNPPPSRGPFAPPDYSLNVYFDHRLTDAQKGALQPIADLLNKAKLGVPDDRIAYFRSVISPDATLVSGWHGSIESVKKVKGGIVVELRITARQSGMLDTANIMERYSIINKKINYLGYYVPNDTQRVQIGH